MNAVVYHWWPDATDSPPIQNLRAPLLPSIATLRASDPNIPIYVLDCAAEHGHSYQDYPQRLGFTVVPWKFSLMHHDDKPGWRHLSRIFDLRRFAETISEEIILYCDTDVFWKKSPLPLRCNPERFCFNKYNTGFFYFGKNSNQASRFFETFEAYTITALNDDNFRFISRQYAGYNEWYHVFDEAILGYMYHKHRELFDVISLEEHCTISAMFPDNEPTLMDAESVRMIHGNGIHVKNEVAKNPLEVYYSRGLIPLVLSEFYEKLIQLLDPLEIYTPEEMAHYKPLQVSFGSKDFIQSIINNKMLNNLYNLIDALKDCERIRSERLNWSYVS